MKTYKYTAININKEQFSGTFIAHDEQDLAEQLAKQELFLISCSQYPDASRPAFFSFGAGRIKSDELTVFCRQFAIMLSTGINMLDCLEYLKGQRFSKYFNKLIAMIYEDVKGGAMLSEAVGKHKNAFPDFFKSMIYIGEASGKPAPIFTALADYYERESSLRRKRKSAAAYPIMLAVLTMAVTLLMLLFVIPRFKEILIKLDIEIEGFTKTVYDISDFLFSSWYYILIGIALLVLLLILIGKTEKGAYFYDKLALHLPFFGKVNLFQITARFARSFSLLLNSGMDMSEAMDAVEIVLVNRDISRRFSLAADEVRQGMPLYLSLQKHKLFPPMLIQMVKLGEETDSIGIVLQRSCGFFEEQVESMLLSAISKIQPIMLILLAVIVLALFLAVYAPMMTIMNGLTLY